MPPSASPDASLVTARSRTTAREVPALLDATNVYAADGANELRGAARFALSRLYVPNSQVELGRRHRPEDVPGRRPLRGRRPAAARRPVLRPEDALRHERHREQPHPDRPADGKARAARSRSTTPTTCTSRPTGASRSSSPRRSHRLDFRDPHTLSPPPLAARPVHGDRPHRLLRRRPLPDRELRVLGQLIKVDVARQRVVADALTCRARGDAAGREALARRPGLLRRRHDVERGLEGGRAPVARDRLHPDRRAEHTASTRAATPGISTSPTGAPAPISVISFATREGRRDLADTGRQPGHGRRLGRRQDALAVRPLRRRGVRDRHRHRTAACARIPVGAGPHGLAVWPQPGRYSLGHTGIMR